MPVERRSIPANASRFPIAVQALVLLARSDDVCPSQMIAGNLHAHAVFTRRVLAPLVAAGLVEAREGRVGGYRLARPADRITLAEVYCALRVASPIELEDHTCPGIAGLRVALNELAAETGDAVTATLARHTIASLAQRAEALAASV